MTMHWRSTELSPLILLSFLKKGTRLSTRITVPRSRRTTIATLILTLKGEYFDAIRAGTKPKEFRLLTPY